MFDPATQTAAGFATGIAQPVDLKVGNDGSLYYLASGSNSLFRVEFPAGPGSGQAPMLFSETDSDLAIAFDSPTFLRDPFALTNTFNFSADKRTRVMLFGEKLELLPTEKISAVTAKAEDLGVERLSADCGVCWKGCGP